MTVCSGAHTIEHVIGTIIAIISLICSIFLVWAMTVIHAQRQIPIGRRYWTVMKMNAWATLAWSINCILIYNCHDTGLSKKTSAEHPHYSVFEIIVIFFGFVSCSLVELGQLALSIVCSVSVLTVAKGSEVSFAEFQILKNKADYKIRRIINFCTIISLLVGMATIICLVKFPSAILFYREIVLLVIAIVIPLLSLGVFGWFYLRIIPFARSIEAVHTSETTINNPTTIDIPTVSNQRRNSPNTTVKRFERLLFRRIALYLAPCFLCLDLLLIFELLNQKYNFVSIMKSDNIRLYCWSSLGVITTWVYFSTEGLYQILFGTSTKDNNISMNMGHFDQNRPSFAFWRQISRNSAHTDHSTPSWARKSDRSSNRVSSSMNQSNSSDFYSELTDSTYHANSSNHTTATDDELLDTVHQMFYETSEQTSC